MLIKTLYSEGTFVRLRPSSKPSFLFLILQRYHGFSNAAIIYHIKYVKRIKMAGEYLFMRAVYLIFAW
jgi:hypothetical protein